MPSSCGDTVGVQRLLTAKETGSGSEGNMSGEKAVGTSCNKFQPNIFNKTKCQNCFKSREVHLLSDGDMEQAKPIYASWLCLAPVGTDFTNPTQRSRKWQRRFFILYERGSLSYALDELLSTLPQGTVNMNLCTDITNAEPSTGQKNALCITTPLQEIFIRGDNKEVINGWNEQLAVYLRTNKQNQKKKRKVEPVANQEPSPAKMAATCPSSQGAVPDSVPWQEEQHGGDVSPVWTVSGPDPSGPDWTPTGNASSYLCQASRSSVTSDGAGCFTTGGNTGSDHSDQSTNVQTSAKSQNQDRSQDTSAEQLLGLGATKKPQRDGTSVCRQGRMEARTTKHENLQPSGCEALLSAPLPVQRRSRSLDRRTSDTVMTPDLLNFKKGWMMKLDEKDQWKKYWFVLSTDRLRFYRDSVAEETSELDGEIDLTKCFSVSEYQVQRNYGFQIHTLLGTFTLSAMTAGIRRNWILALMKNVHPGNAPDVASLPGHHIPCSPPELIPKPDVTQDSASKGISMETDPHSKSRGVTERRHEGRYKTFDWSEIRPQNEETDYQKPLSPLELGDLERRRRREERRRRYESMLGFSLGQTGTQKIEDGDVRALSPQSQLRMEKEIEECWRKVEKSGFIAERKVLLSVDARDGSEVEKLHSYRKMVEDLKAQLAESECCRLKLEAWISTTGFYQEQPDLPVPPEALFCPVDMKDEQLKGLNDFYGESREGFYQQQHVKPQKQEHLQLKSSSSAPQLPSIWLKDTEDNLQQLYATSNSQQDTSQLEGPGSGLHLNGSTAHHLDQLDRENHQLFPASETNRDFQIVEETTHEDSTLGLDASDPSVVKHLSQQVEELTRQNTALDQQNQEMINQLMEADREIERLKTELSNKLSEAHLIPELKLKEKIMEDLEKQLSLRNQELLDAQTLICSLGTEVLKSTAEAEAPVEEGSETSEECLLQCLQAAETKMMEVEKQLEESKQTCRQLMQQNTELKQTGELYLQRASEAEADLRRLKEELEKQQLEEEEKNRTTDEEQIQQVTEGMVTGLRALEKLLEVINRLDFIRGAEEEQEESHDVVRQLRWEEEFWKLLLNKLKDDLTQLEDPVGVLLSEVTEGLMLETRVLLEAHKLLLQTGELTGSQPPESRTSTALNGATEPEPSMFGFKQLSEMEHLKAFTEIKISLLEQTSSIRTSALDELLLAANRLYDPHSSPNPRPVLFLHSAAAEALFCCRLARLRSRCERGLCCSCIGLQQENQELKAKLSDMEEERSLSFGSRMSACCQTDEIYLQGSESQPQNDPSFGVQTVLGEQLGEGEEEESNMEVSDVVVEVTQLDSVTDQMKEDFHQKMSVVQKQHEEEMDKLKVTCERGLAAMEECHQKVVEELRRLHQQEVERLLVERDRLLEEESTATATAIEAIQNAHRVELQREVQRRCQSENGNTQLEEIHRQHREELASIQRELDVLSQQFSLKCLEIGHLVQALDAERKALCQCQQENQDLRSRNQELSAHLAAEITKLCSMAKQDALPLSQGMDVYEMEITLRLKESEVQCLQQEVTSLKDELQAVLKDKRNAMKKYKDVLTELSVVRARGEREADELRENLKLAHQALNHTPA